ncbi:MAG: glycosyltransferase family 2 protein [Eubacteriales bacterium]
MLYPAKKGVPQFEAYEFHDKKSDSCLLIPIINEGERIIAELTRAKNAGVDSLCDIIICDGDSSDSSTESESLKALGVNTLLVKKDTGKQGAQLRMGIWFALQRGYKNVLTIDGNNKDSIESVSLFIEKLNAGYDFVQGSRYIAGGKAINTPLSRHLAVRLIHAPVISKIAGEKFTDTTNAFRGYSAAYLLHPDVHPLRDIFITYELLAYLSVRASQLGLKTCEVPVTRAYPEKGKTPTKISPIKGNWNLLKILWRLSQGRFNP